MTPGAGVGRLGGGVWFVGYGALEDDQDLRVQRSMFSLGESDQFAMQAAIQADDETDELGHAISIFQNTGRHDASLVLASW